MVIILLFPTKDLSWAIEIERIKKILTNGKLDRQLVGESTGAPTFFNNGGREGAKAGNSHV